MNRNYLFWFALALVAIGAIVGAVVILLPEQTGSAPIASTPSATVEQNSVKRVGIAAREGEQSAEPDKPSSRRRSPELEALYELAERDFPAALAEAKRVYADGRWKDVQGALAAYVLEKDFSRAAEICALIEDTVTQHALMETVPNAFRRDRAATTSIVFDQLTGPARDCAAYSIVRTQLEDGDLLAAMQSHLRLPDSSLAIQSAHQIGDRITSRDLSAGLRWFEQLSTDEQRKTAHGEMMENLRGAGDADGLTQLLVATPPEETIKPGGTRLWNRSIMISSLAGIRQKKQDTEGLQALRAMLGDEEKEFVDLGIFYTERDKPVRDRFDRAVSFTNPDTRSSALSAVIGGEVSKDPNKTADFVLGLGDEGFGKAIWYFIQSWKSKDLEATAGWVRGLPTGPRREKTIGTFVMTLRHGRGSEKELAREFAALAADPSVHEKLLRQIPSILSERERAAGGR